jgi:hypothetical protein
LRQQTAAAVERQPSIAPRAEARTERKRLGRSLDALREPSAKPAT